MNVTQAQFDLIVDEMDRRGVLWYIPAPVAEMYKEMVRDGEKEEDVPKEE